MYWGEGKISHVNKDGAFVGYEAVCYRHTCKKIRCTRSRAFHLHGGMVNVERMLKSWLLKGASLSIDTKTAHYEVADDSLVALPSLEAVEKALSAVVSPPSAKRRKKGA